MIVLDVSHKVEVSAPRTEEHNISLLATSSQEPGAIMTRHHGRQVALLGLRLQFASYSMSPLFCSCLMYSEYVGNLHTRRNVSTNASAALSRCSIQIDRGNAWNIKPRRFTTLRSRESYRLHLPHRDAAVCPSTAPFNLKSFLHPPCASSAPRTSLMNQQLLARERWILRHVLH